MKIFNTELGWCYICWKSKPYINITKEYECILWYTFSITKINMKEHKKRWGYWEIWYDQPFSFFNLGLVTIHWGTLPSIIKNLKTGETYGHK